MNAISNYQGAHKVASSFNSIKSSTSSYVEDMQDRLKGDDNSQSLRRLKHANSSVDVSTYTDKEGRVHRTYTGKGTDVVDAMQKAHAKTNENKPVVKKRLNYSYQKVSNQVIMAKNSVSASKAVLSARRALSDLKRALRTAECSDDEKQIALTHATRMLQIAKKKRKNLELEELVHNTIKSDERLDKESKANSRALELSGAFDDNQKKPSSEEDILKKLAGDGEESATEYEKNNSLATIKNLQSDIAYETDETIITDDILDEAQEAMDLFDELSEDMNDELSEVLNELMDIMEIINPHMDSDDLEKLKTKHRLEEQKEIVKADTDYLKEYIRIIKQEQAEPVNNTSQAPTEAQTSMMPFEITPTIPTESSLGFSVIC